MVDKTINNRERQSSITDRHAKLLISTKSWLYYDKTNINVPLSWENVCIIYTFYMYRVRLYIYNMVWLNRHDRKCGIDALQKSFRTIYSLLRLTLFYAPLEDLLQSIYCSSCHKFSSNVVASLSLTLRLHIHNMRQP